MPVGHGGNMSKHPPKEKLAILEFIEARLKDIVEKKFNLSPEVVHVYDPITTKWDFYVFLDVSWNLYERIYSEYFNPANEPDKREKKVRDLYPNIIKPFPWIFNATDSKTDIFKTIDEMYELLPYLKEQREA